MATILVVDDRPTNREFLVTLLGYKGYRMLEAGDGAEALGVMRAERPDLAIVDIVMPTMDGYEFVRQLRADPAIAQTRVIFYTATYLQAETWALARACGVHHIITKPAEPEMVLKSVAEALDLAVLLPQPFSSEEFHREHLRVITDKLFKQVEALEQEVAERKRAEEALREKSEEVRAISRQLWQAAKLATMGELAATIAHELNNPLTTVSLRVESLLAQLPADDPKHGALEVVEQEVERMSTLVANLLQTSRRASLQISTLDVREEIGKTLELMQFHLRNRHITTAQESALEVPMVQADRQQLRQLFLNLFTNASDAMPQGGTLTIRVGMVEKHVVIEVADTGVGIAPKDLPKVLEPFFTTKPEGRGTGLGLAICRRIVHGHQGTLEIASGGLGKGTVVRITLPSKNGSNAASVKES